MRITLHQDGLTLATAILDPSKVPHTVVIDFGIESVATAPLRTIIEAAAKFRDGANDGNSQQATQRMLGAAAMLTPVFRIYQLSLATQEVGIEATAEAKGSPLSPKGYTAEGDVTVRGFDAVSNLVGDAPFADYLPLLKVLGTSGGGSEVKFHLASAPQKWITLNGNDISGWLASDEAGQPRALRPALPPAEGNDVRAVQKALAAAGMTVPQSGVYEGASAAAVAQFQKKNGLNADGVVNAATRQKLGVKPEPAKPDAAPKQPPARRSN